MENMKRCVASIIVVMALLAGCSKPEDKFVGKWDGKVELPKEFVAMMEGMAKAFASTSKDPNAKAPDLQGELDKAKLELDLQKSGQYVLTTTSTKGTTTESGTWKLSEDGKTIKLTLPKDAQQKLDSTPGSPNLGNFGKDGMTFNVAEGNKAMALELNQAGMSIKFSFTKR